MLKEAIWATRKTEEETERHEEDQEKKFRRRMAEFKIEQMKLQMKNQYENRDKIIVNEESETT